MCINSEYAHEICTHLAKYEQKSILHASPTR